MKKVEDYRRRAAECHSRSQSGPSPEIRDHYRNLALMWEQLAQQRLHFFVPEGEARPKPDMT